MDYMYGWFWKSNGNYILNYISLIKIDYGFNMFYKYDVRKKRINNCSVLILCNIYSLDIVFVILEK